jgi:2-polyprenyl-3-methyl-5-hydroxy-6-metoxy-1,4-benzoquinol methylase
VNVRHWLAEPFLRGEVTSVEKPGGILDEHFEPAPELDLAGAIASGDLAAIHHLLRYAWAEALLRSTPPAGPILDLGCGAGYGSFHLAKALPGVPVLGVDYDSGAVETAHLRYHLPNLTYRVGNPLRWDMTIGRGFVHTIVLFDVLEHVAHREVLLEQLVTHLLPNGQVLLSTPCGSGATDLQPAWEFHKIEYSAASLFDFLSRYFATLTRPEDSDFPARSVFDDAFKRGVHYLMQLNPVICREPRTILNPYRGY